LRRPGVLTAIRAAGARLLGLSAHSPDLNWIETAFSKLKALLRKAAERYEERVWAKLGERLPAFAPTERDNFFA
jgi:transposase